MIILSKPYTISVIWGGGGVYSALYVRVSIRINNNQKIIVTNIPEEL